MTATRIVPLLLICSHGGVVAACAPMVEGMPPWSLREPRRRRGARVRFVVADYTPLLLLVDYSCVLRAAVAVVWIEGIILVDRSIRW